MDVIDTLGLDIQTFDWEYTSALPLYITRTFTIKKAVVNDIICIMLIPKEDLPTIPNLIKQMTYIKNLEQNPIFLNLSHLSNYKKEHLLKNRIPFILATQLAYLPFMGTILTNKHVCIEKPDQFTMSAQLLFIWILYRNTNRFFIMEALSELPFSGMTMTRAYRYLTRANLFIEKKEGRKIYLATNYAKKELFEKAKPYLISPIYKTGYIDQEALLPEMIESGTLALSNYTMINPSYPLAYALDKKYKGLIHMNDELTDPKTQVKVELWEYDPSLFSKNRKHIDVISLAISLLNNEDERIESAIEDLIHRIGRDLE